MKRRLFFAYHLPVLLLLFILSACHGNMTNKASQTINDRRHYRPCPSTYMEIPAPYKIATDWFCNTYNIDTFLVNAKDDPVGGYGIFDSTMWRMQMVFTRVELSKTNSAVYDVEGASMVKMKIKYFKGFIHIDTVKKYDRNYWFSKDTCDFADNPDFLAMRDHQFDEKNLEFSASFFLFEDSIKAGNGKFQGKLHFYLTLVDSTKKIIADMGYWEGAIGPGNFIYTGTYRKYNSTKATYVPWSPEKIEELYTGTADGWRPCWDEKLKNKGWKTDERCRLLLDPKLWWLKK
jgi:hypothetical protein